MLIYHLGICNRSISSIVMADSETEYCQHYSITAGTYYSSCNGYCCGETTNQECCYDSYDTDYIPALALGAVFGVVFAIVIIIVLVFLCQVMCCPKRERIVEPKDLKKNRVKHFKKRESNEIYLKPTISNSTYLKPVHYNSMYLKPVISNSTYLEAVNGNSTYLKPVMSDSTNRKTVFNVNKQSEPLYVSVDDKTNTDKHISYLIYTD